MSDIRGTTVVSVRRGAKVAIASDGQVTLKDGIIVKHGARKVRRLHNGRVLAGFAGGVADALALFERFEAKLGEHGGSLPRAAVELCKDWRTDRYLRRLEALMVACDEEHTLILSGGGEVIEPDDDAAAIGSGAGYALAAARGLLVHTDLSPREIAEEAIRLASGVCLYTNSQVSVEEL